MVNFTSKESFLDFYIAAVIVGSILGMNRNLLIKAALGYLPVILGGVVVSLLLTGVVGFITGYGFLKAVFFIAIPIMGGGMGAGAVNGCNARGMQVITGVTGSPDEAALLFAKGELVSSGSVCSHHGDHHHGEGHDCSHHGSCGH